MKYIDFFGAFIALFWALILVALLMSSGIATLLIEIIAAVLIAVAIYSQVKNFRLRRRLYKKYKGWKCGRLDEDFWKASISNKLWVYDHCFDDKQRKLIMKHCAAEMQRTLEEYPFMELNKSPERDKKLAKWSGRLKFAATNI